jgi:hypothetical protein
VIEGVYELQQIPTHSCLVAAIPLHESTESSNRRKK